MARSGGSAHVTPPYSDAATGNICYTVSVMLPDKETVLGVDYTMDNIQAHVAKMNEAGLRCAVIVTEDGIIAGGSDEALIGDTLLSRLPEYSAVFYLAKNSEEFVTHRIKSGMLYENLFAACSGAGWYLIVSMSDWELYGNSYLQLIAVLTLTLALIGVIIVPYVIAIRTRSRAEDALHARDVQLAQMAADLEKPLKQIMTGSDLQNYPGLDITSDRLTGIHEAGEQITGLVQKLLSSPVVQSAASKEKKREKTEMKHGMNRHFRSLILFLQLISLSTRST